MVDHSEEGTPADNVSRSSALEAMDAMSDFSPTPWMGWRAWMEQGIPEPDVCLELFRLVLIGDFPYPLYDVPRWVWFLLDPEVCMPRRAVDIDLYPGLCSFQELHAFLRIEHRLGLCRWRELIIRRLRREFRPFPFDFEELFRYSQETALGPDLLILGRYSVDTAWNLMSTGVSNPREDGAGNLDWDHAQGNDANIAEDDGEHPADEQMMSDHAEEIPDHVRTQGILPADPVNLPDSEENPIGTDPQNFRCGGLNDELKGRFKVLFDQVKLEALFSGLSDSARVSYQSSWHAWGRFCFVRGISVWLVPGVAGWDEPLLDFLI